MSLSATLSNALSGLSAAQRALSVTANNVANANTDGYSRKQVNQATQIVDGQSLGVRSLEPSRVVDQFLTGELRRQESTLGRDTVIAEAFARIERGILGPPGEQDRGLPAQLGRLQAELEQLANDPESRPLRTAVLGSIEDVLRQLAADSATVQQLRGDADRRIGQAVQAINGDIAELHALNQEIARSGGSADLEDRRDLILRQLAGKIDISTFRHDDGRIAVYTSGGHALLEQTPRVLHYAPAATIDDTAPLGPIRIFMANQVDPTSGAPLPGFAGEVLVSGGYRATITPELQAQGLTDAITSPLTGGSLAGLLEVRDRVLPELADQLGEVGQLLAHSLNRAHNAAMPYPLPTAVVGSRQDFTDFPAAPADLAGTATLAVFAGDGTVAADIAVTIAGATGPADIATQIDTALGGLGTAQLDPATGALTITLGNDPGGEPYRLAWDEGDSRITVTDDAGHAWSYGFAHYFGLNDLVVPGGGAAFSVRPDIAADNRLLANVVMSRDAGVPVVGGIGDKRGLQALAGALDSEVASVARGGLPAATTTVGRYVADITALAAAQSAQAQNREAADRALVEDLAFRQGAVSGVNLDEELAKLVLFQQAYSVSARLISITNELFAELVDMTR
jgi:flagellar hook-associated protein 1 FlgK